MEALPDDNMSKQELELISSEILDAVNHGRFNEAARKICEAPSWEESRDLFSIIEQKIPEYEFQRLYRLYVQNEPK